MNNEACTGIRIYYGMTENLEIHAIIVGSDADGRDMLPDNNSMTENSENEIFEEGQRCPRSCPPGSPLNES